MDLYCNGHLEAIDTSEKSPLNESALDQSDFELQVQDMREPQDTSTPIAGSMLNIADSNDSGISESVSNSSMIQSMDDDTSTTKTDLDPNNSCEPCQYRGHTRHATKFCPKCDERYCDECSFNHTVQKQTKHHVLQAFIVAPPAPKPQMCEPCELMKKNQDATFRCENCDELLCNACKDFHLSQKVNKNHSIQTLSLLNCDVCSATGKPVPAACFCLDCDHPDALCLACADQHTAMKNSRNHKMSSDLSLLISKMSLKEYEEENGISSKGSDINVHTACAKVQSNPICDACDFQGKQLTAIEYCVECEEKCCEDCSRRHKSHPKTKEHELLNLKSLMSPTYKCDVCAFNDTDIIATSTCEECDEHLCSECSEHHKGQKLTRSHEIKPLYNYDVCKGCELVGIHEKGTSYCLDCEESEIFCNPCAARHVSMKHYRGHKISGDLIALKVRILKEKEKTYQQDGVKKSDIENVNRPGRPYVIDTTTSNSLKVQWEEINLEENETYQLTMKDVANGRWKTCRETTSKSGMMQVDGLQPNTRYVFRVRKINDIEGTEGEFSEESEVISTGESPAIAVMKTSALVYEKPINVYALPLRELKNARNNSARTRKLCLGVNDGNPIEKNVMIVGATGSGKSTLINAMANYIIGVTWEDPFRFTLVDVETDEQAQAGDQAHSQTQWITSYTIYSTASTRLSYTVNLIDTPGFGDTR